MLSYMYSSQLLTSKYQVMYPAAVSEDWLHGSESSTSIQSLLIQLKGHKVHTKQYLQNTKLCTSCWQTRGKSRSVNDYPLRTFSILRKLPVQRDSCQNNKGRLKTVFQSKSIKNNWVNSFHVRVNSFSECRHENLLTRQDKPCHLKMPITVKHLKRLSTPKNNPEWSGKTSMK
jgi:hypothetical protein